MKTIPEILPALPFALHQNGHPAHRLGLTLALVLWAAQTYAKDPLFLLAGASPITVGKGSGEVILADLNLDGHLDMLTKHLLTQNVSVRLGDGKGKFAQVAEGPMSFDYQPGAIALGDVNNDKIPDLGVASKDSDKEYVQIFLGDGRGSFARVSASPFTVSASAKYYKPILRFMDVNEDGKLDIITANGRRNTIEILFGDGRGKFLTGPIVRLESGQSRYSFAVGDVDGDGHLDLVTVSRPESDSEPGRIVTKRGDGKGGFSDARGAPLPARSDPRIATLADVNGDERLDIVLGHGTSLVSVMMNDGKGVFTSALGSPLSLASQVSAVIVADANKDKNADLFMATVDSVAAPFPSKIVVLLGNGRGFAPAPGSPFPAGPGAYNLAVRDVDEDGKIDVAASSFEGDAVTMLVGR